MHDEGKEIRGKRGLEEGREGLREEGRNVHREAYLKGGTWGWIEGGRGRYHLNLLLDLSRTVIFFNPFALHNTHVILSNTARNIFVLRNFLPSFSRVQLNIEKVSTKYNSYLWHVLVLVRIQ